MIRKIKQLRPVCNGTTIHDFPREPGHCCLLPTFFIFVCSIQNEIYNTSYAANLDFEI